MLTLAGASEPVPDVGTVGASRVADPLRAVTLSPPGVPRSDRAEQARARPLGRVRT